MLFAPLGNAKAHSLALFCSRQISSLTNMELQGNICLELQGNRSNNMDKEIVGASTVLVILGELAKEPNYGYEIVRRVNAAADGIFEWQEGTIYPVLHKLEKEQLVR